MKKDQLYAISPLDGRYKKKVEVLNKYFSEAAYIQYRIKIEVYWFQTLFENGIVGSSSIFSVIKKTTDSWVKNLTYKEICEVKKIEVKINHDVKAVEYFLKQKAKKSENKVLEKKSEFFHFGCTSEDINNLCHSSMLNDFRNQSFVPQLESIVLGLSEIALRTAEVPMISRTHGQTASPTTLGKELANFRSRLRASRDRFKKVSIKGKFNGAVGNFNAYYVANQNVNWINVSKTFVKKLGFEYNSMTTQIEPHDWIGEYCDALASINVILIDLCRDLWGYISLGYFVQKMKKNEVGSSTMPHKINPIDFENAEGNLGISNALLRYFSDKLPVSRFQRDLSDSTVIRNLGVAFAHSYLANDSIIKGLKKLIVNKKSIEKDLHISWEVLAEPIQTVMRANGIPNPYEKLKLLTRGTPINENIICKFIDTLDLPKSEKLKLKLLTPANYIGVAKKLVKEELKKS